MSFAVSMTRYNDQSTAISTKSREYFMYIYIPIEINMSNDT